MKKLFLIPAAVLILTVVFTLTTSNVLTAQVTAGSIPSGMYVYNPNVNLSVATCNMYDSTTFDINCDGTPDVAIDIYKGYTPIDGTSYALLYVLNDTFEICTDTAGNFSGYFGTTGRPHYYNTGDTLNCTGNSMWRTDSIYTLGDCGGWLITGPQSKTNVYIAYRKGSQIGWINLSFNLIDGTVCSNPITLSIASVLAPCNSNAVEEIFSIDNIHISPNPFSTQTTLQTDNLLHNATLTVYNSYGQQVKQFIISRNEFGTGSNSDLPTGQAGSFVIRRDNLPSGLYFVRLTEENKIIAVNKLVITDK